MLNSGESRACIVVDLSTSSLLAPMRFVRCWNSAYARIHTSPRNGAAWFDPSSGSQCPGLAPEPVLRVRPSQVIAILAVTGGDHADKATHQ